MCAALGELLAGVIGMGENFASVYILRQTYLICISCNNMQNKTQPSFPELCGEVLHPKVMYKNAMS